MILGNVTPGRNTEGMTSDGSLPNATLIERIDSFVFFFFISAMLIKAIDTVERKAKDGKLV